MTSIIIRSRPSGHTFHLIWDNTINRWSRIESSTTIFEDGAWVPITRAEQTENILYKILSQAIFSIDEKQYKAFEVIDFTHVDFVGDGTMTDPEANR